MTWCNIGNVLTGSLGDVTIEHVFT